MPSDKKLSKWSDKKLLRKFCKRYLKWVKKGAKDGEPFNRDTGLCDNAEVFCNHGLDATERLHDALKRGFQKKSLDTMYPFGGMKVFNIERDKNEQHLNKDRIKWVKEHAK